jgi:hypothetical protein
MTAQLEAAPAEERTVAQQLQLDSQTTAVAQLGLQAPPALVNRPEPFATHAASLAPPDAPGQPPWYEWACR